MPSNPENLYQHLRRHEMKNFQQAVTNGEQTEQQT
jgi:hypothetical protein